MQQNTLAIKTDPVVGSTPTQDIDDFIYLMSHDGRASVRALLELPHWIAEDLTEAGVRVSGSVAQSIDLMNRHAARLDRLLTDLLAYSRIGRMQEVCEVDLAESIDEVLSALKVPEGFRVIRHLDCRRCVIGEQDILTLWSAMIGNAIKHHDSTRGKIAVQAAREDGMIRFTVMDDGPGIKEQLRARAMEAMTTLRPRDEVEGTGMGLANLRRMASHYGGAIRLSSAYPDGRGLRVDLLIPDKAAPS